MTSMMEQNSKILEEDHVISFQITVRHIPIKRMFDLLFSSLVLILGSPFFALLALTIRLSSKGKVIYWQQRVGRGGKLFRCYKFRTMYRDAEHRLKDLLAADPELRAEWESSFKLKNDPRVTPFGRFLRKTSLDELPQFWNVLKGDLSVVGPRPVVQQELKKFFGPVGAKILSVRPGITGLWQVGGRSNTSYRTRVQLDIDYVENHSLALDLKLIAKTIPVVIFSRGAY